MKLPEKETGEYEVAGEGDRGIKSRRRRRSEKMKSPEKMKLDGNLTE